MTHSNAWDSSYEAEFTDDNYGYEIDNYLRKLILAIRERMEIDHVWKDSTATDGEHSKVTLPVLTTDPDAVASKGIFYTKDVDEKAEGFYLGEDGDAVQLTSGGVVSIANVTLKCKVIEIGNWNMDDDATLDIAHGLTITDIRSLQVLIRADDDSDLCPLNLNTTGDIEGYFYLDATNVKMGRAATGRFDTSDYDDDADYNRGWITIWYIA